MSFFPLILTATIHPQTNYELNLTDSKKRYYQYIHNLIRLISLSDFQEFVFCENSLAGIADKEMIEKLCDFYGKKIEFISFKGNDELIKKYTRAYGDQEIMEYAVRHSQILKNHNWFYKLTWRYWIKNINEVIKAWSNKNNVFIRWWFGKNTVHTCFFKTTKSYFKEHFDGKYKQLEKFENYSLERLYYYYVKQSWINMTINSIHPEFSWEWGAGGFLDESFLMKIKTKIFAYLWVYDIKTTKIQ